MTDLAKSFRVIIIPLDKHYRTDKLVWTMEGFAAFKLCQKPAISKCQELYFLEDNRHFILKTDHTNLTYLNIILTGKM
jgi:hypothetical protein